MELRDYWHTVRRRWKVIVACLVVAVAAAAVVTFQMTPQYSSTARLFVSTSPSDSSEAYQGSLFATQRVTSYADLVNSRRLAETVADDLAGEQDPSQLMASVEAQVVPETVNLEITATAASPELARDVAQAYAEGLAALVDDLETPEGEQDAPIRASIIDDAQVSPEPVSPQVVRNLGLAAVLGLLLGLGLAVMRELLDTSITSSEDVAEVSDAPVVAHIAVDPTAVRRSPVEALDGTSPWAEAFRVLRTNLQYVQVDSDTKVVVVSSSLPGEGKTTTAVNLAITLAMAGQRTALVECDLRRPLVADRLGLEPAVGTTSVLVGKISLADALQRYDDTGLMVLTSGPIPPNPSELLQSHAMETLLAQLRSEFDVIVLDAPPLLPVTDAALLTAQADGALVVVRHGKTTRDQLAHALDRLEAVEAKALGVVVNMAPAKRKGQSAYGYGYGYGYSSRPDAIDSRLDALAERSPAPDADAGAAPAGQRVDAESAYDGVSDASARRLPGGRRRGTRSRR